jgi:hypothetical protein
MDMGWACGHDVQTRNVYTSFDGVNLLKWSSWKTEENVRMTLIWTL